MSWHALLNLLSSQAVASALAIAHGHLSLREVVNARTRGCDFWVRSSIEEVTMIQQGQLFKLKARGADGRPLWAYRHRLDGRRSARPQVGGFASRAEAEQALRKALARLRPGGCAATMTVADLVEEYLGMHQGEPVTIAKLRWLLGKATSALGLVRVADLSAKDVYAWRQTIPEGHRFEATQALRQVLNRAVEWEWLADNPAKRVPNLPRRAKEKRPFESWGADRGRRRSTAAGVQGDGDLRRRHWPATLRAVRARVA